MKQRSTADQQLDGGIIIQDDLNWKYCKYPISDTNDLSGWDCFYPEQYGL
jgi:hypothetical protein